MKPCKKLLAAFMLLLMLSSLTVVSACAAPDEGVKPASENPSTAVVTCLLDEPEEDQAQWNNEDDPGVTVEDAGDIAPQSADVSKSVNLRLGKSYSYGAFYMNCPGSFGQNAGDRMEVTVSAVSSGRYKVIVQGIQYSGFMGMEQEVVLSFESAEHSTPKIFTLPGESGVAYTVTVLNTSAENLKANVSVVTCQS